MRIGVDTGGTFTDCVVLEGSRVRIFKVFSSPENAARAISFDMGGTSTDVSLLDGAPRTTHETVLGGLPVAVPVLDVHSVGAGGGSLARLDAGGALRVGPEKPEETGC